MITFCDTRGNIAGIIASKVGCSGSGNYDYGLQPSCTGTIFVLKLIFPWSHFGISFPFRRGLFQSYLYKIVVQASPGALEFIVKSVNGAKFRWFVLTDMFQSYVIKFRILYQIEFGYGFWNRFSKLVNFDNIRKSLYSKSILNNNQYSMLLVPVWPYLF